jgi:hypothetical protein
MDSSVCIRSYRMSHVQEDHDEAFLPFVGIISAELTSATVVTRHQRLASPCKGECEEPVLGLPTRDSLPSKQAVAFSTLAWYRLAVEADQVRAYCTLH